MDPDFYLLAHSHAVSLLDAATDWRARVQLAGTPDPRFGAPFQGWFGGTIPARPLELACTRDGSSLRAVTAWIMPPGGAVGHLATVDRDSAGELRVQVNPDFLAVLHDWSGVTPIVSMIRGNEHALTMLARFPAYDFLDPAVPGVVPGVPILDEGLIDDYVSPWTDTVFHALEVVRRETSNPLLHIFPPPPREHPERAQHLEEIADVVREYGFVPASLRLKWYHRYCRLLATRLAAIGCTTLAAPAEACTPDGLLREEFSEGLTHGNRRYGDRVAAQVESWIAGLPR